MVIRPCPYTTKVHFGHSATEVLHSATEGFDSRHGIQLGREPVHLAHDASVSVEPRTDTSMSIRRPRLDAQSIGRCVHRWWNRRHWHFVSYNENWRIISNDTCNYGLFSNSFKFKIVYFQHTT